MTPFVKGSFDNAASLCLKQLTQAMLLRKHISMPAKLEDLNLPPILIGFLKRNLTKSNRNTRNQNKRDFIKNCKFCDSSHPRGTCPAYGKVCHVCNKKNDFRVCCPRVGKKVHEIEKVKSDEPSDQSNYEFFIET